MADRTVAVKLQADVSSYINGLNRAQSATTSLDRASSSSFGRVGGSIGNVTGHLNTLLYTATRVTGIIGGLGLGAALVQGLSTASFEEQAQQSFTTLLGNAQQAKKFLGDLASFAAATPFELPGLVDNARQLLGVGMAAKDVIPTLTAWGDAAGALGLSQDQMNRAMLAVTQSMAKGKVQSEEMMQLTEAGIPAWNLLAQATGKNVPELQAMAQQGTLLAKDVMPAMTVALEKLYGGSMAKQSQTLAGVWSTVKDNMNLALADGVRPLAEGLKVVLPDASATAADAIRTMGARGSEAIIELIKRGEELRTRFGPEIAELGDVAAQKWHQFTTLLSELGHEVGPSLPGLIDSLVQIAKVGGELSRDMLPVFQAGMKAAGPVAQALAGTLRIVADALQAIEPILPAVVTGFLAFKGLSAASSALSSLRGALGGVAGNLDNAAIKAGLFTEKITGSSNLGEKVMTGMGKASGAVNAFGSALPVVGLQLGLVGAAMDQSAQQTSRWTEALKQGGSAARQAQAEMAKTKATVDSVTTGFVGFGTAITGQGGLFKAVTPDAREANKAYDDWKKTLDGVGLAQLNVAQAQTHLNDVMSDPNHSALAAHEAAQSLAVAQADLAQKQQSAAQATANHTRAMVDQATQAMSTASADLAVSNAALQVKQAQDAYTQALKDSNATAEQRQQAENSLTAAYLQAAQAAVQKAQADNVGKDQATINAAATQAQLKVLQQMAQAAGGQVPAAIAQLIASLQASGAQSDVMRGKVEQLGLTIIGLPNDHFVDIKAPTADQMERLQALKVKVETLPDGNIRIDLDDEGARLKFNTLMSDYRSTTVTVPLARAGSNAAMADGGRITGPGGPRDDVVPIMASNGEFIVNAAQTARYLPMLEWINNGKSLRNFPGDLIPQYANGGLVMDRNAPDTYWPYWSPPSVDANVHIDFDVSALRAAMEELAHPKGLEAALDFAYGQVGKPYIWGGVGPDGYDCSGFMSAITNVAQGQYPYGRRGTTYTFPWPGFAPGFGDFTIGSSQEHMAGTLIGHNVESTGDHVRMDSAAAGAGDGQFGVRAHLAMAGGGVIGEPVYGYGLNSGRSYSFAEFGPETVVPSVLSSREVAGVLSGASGGSAPNVTIQARVFVGDREITDIARVEAETVTAQALSYANTRFRNH